MVTSPARPFQSMKLWLVLALLVVVAVVMAADSGRVNRFSGDCIIELLMRIQRYMTDRDKHTMLKCRSKIRFGELS